MLGTGDKAWPRSCVKTRQEEHDRQVVRGSRYFDDQGWTRVRCRNSELTTQSGVAMLTTARPEVATQRATQLVMTRLDGLAGRDWAIYR
jgi:hypothetical protein